MLAVGDSTILEIIYSSKASKNTVRKQPRIQTNAGKPDKTVRIVAEVVTRPDSLYPIVFSPYKLDLLQLGTKTRSQIEFTVTNVSDTQVETEIVSMPDGFFDVEMPSSIGPGKSAKGKLTLRPDALEKGFEKSFTIELNDEKNSRYTIPVKRTIRSAGGQANQAAKNPKKGR